MRNREILTNRSRLGMVYPCESLLQLFHGAVTLELKGGRKIRCIPPNPTHHISEYSITCRRISSRSCSRTPAFGVQSPLTMTSSFRFSCCRRNIFSSVVVVNDGRPSRASKTLEFKVCKYLESVKLMTFPVFGRVASCGHWLEDQKSSSG
jgi:hypothetical protein